MVPYVSYLYEAASRIFLEDSYEPCQYELDVANGLVCYFQGGCIPCLVVAYDPFLFEVEYIHFREDAYDQIDHEVVDRYPLVAASSSCNCGVECTLHLEVEYASYPYGVDDMILWEVACVSCPSEGAGRNLQESGVFG